MNRSVLILLGVIVLGAVVWTVRGPNYQQETMSKQPPAEQDLPENAELATFAGGCFWCIEPAFQEEEGVIDAVAGYAGGEIEDPTYEQVSSGKTKYKEAVQVTYDPSVIDYASLVQIFWTRIDPTDADGQFVDRGPQYTTAIFYHNETQRQIAEESKETMELSGEYDGPIVTEILPYTTFYLAEDYHQDFYLHSAERYKNYKDNSGRPEYVDDE